MTEYVYSEYYRNPPSFSKEEIDTFSLKKISNIHYLTLNNRTICGIHRAIYKFLLTHKNNVNAQRCKESILQSHYAVLKLRDYKKDFDRGWWEDAKHMPKLEDGWWKNNKYYKGKTFTESDKKFAQDLMSTEDNIYIFDLIRDMYNATNEEGIRHLLLEIIWMSYRINKKMVEYEQHIKTVSSVE